MSFLVTGSHHIAEYCVKLMDIDANTLGIPETDYDACVTMTSPEFSRIVRDLSFVSEYVRIEVSKEGVRFVSDGKAAPQTNNLLKQTDAARERYENYGKVDDDDDVVRVKEEDEDEAEFQAKSEDEDEEPSDSKNKKRKPPAVSSPIRFFHSSYLVSVLSPIVQDSKAKKKAKRVADDSGERGSAGVHIEMVQHVSLTFLVKYLVNFSKSAALSDTVQLMFKNDNPLLLHINEFMGIPLTQSPMLLILPGVIYV
jgi:proliferating cell nuclear antigen